MILQKLASAIRRQDWFQVVIEVMIVIVGIYLGFQVTEWDSQRKAEAEQVEYLERLLVDADNSITHQQTDLENNSERYENIQAAVKMLHEKRINAENIAEFENLASLSGARNSLNFYRDTLDEMIASGRLANVASPELKRAIAEFREFMRTLAVVNDTVARQIGDQAMHLRLMFKMDPTRTVSLTSPEELNNDDVFYNHLNNQAFMYSQFNFIQNRFHQSTITFREEIAAELARHQ